MLRRLIVTDLTRFKKGNDDVCIAGIDVESGECIRPFRYLTQKECQSHNILPGSFLQGEFEKSKNIVLPHTEDHNWSALESDGHCSSGEFEQILINSCSTSVEDGFGVVLANGKKSIAENMANHIKASIITINVPVKGLKVVEDAYDNTKVKIHFIDNSGKSLSFVPITDFGYYNFIKDRQSKIPTALNEINAFIQLQNKVYLRVGLARAWNGEFWIQVNGIYTFPDFHSEIRSYK